jgi:hypothetical protein
MYRAAGNAWGRVEGLSRAPEFSNNSPRLHEGKLTTKPHSMRKAQTLQGLPSTIVHKGVTIDHVPVMSLTTAVDNTSPDSFRTAPPSSGSSQSA